MLISASVLRGKHHATRIKWARQKGRMENVNKLTG